jgi:ATP-binding cassette, subfamily C (CFTR/MRP), member 1
MNNVERVTYYGDLPQEAAPTLPNDPPAEWPEHGHLKFNNVQMRYREGLPLVLKGVTFEAMPGEKVGGWAVITKCPVILTRNDSMRLPQIGIVGRTGAGKSSLAQALFRIVELADGNIEIDGVDLRNVGLDTLRTRLSAIPQDALLYGGTMRENLDPTGAMTDADLYDALRRCDLIPAPNAPAQELARFDKFKLDAIVSDDGSNFSGGERQLGKLGA